MRQLLEYGMDFLDLFRSLSSYLLSGWMHNRCRMTVAMYLTKDLMLDWRHGERVSTLSFRKKGEHEHTLSFTVFHAKPH